MPLACGSTSVSIACTATAASTAEPPWRSICTPACTASGCAAETMKRVAVCSVLACRPEAASGSGAAGGALGGAGAWQAASAAATKSPASAGRRRGR